MRKLFIIIQFVFISTLLLVSGCSGCKKSPPTVLTVNFIVDGEFLCSENVNFGKTVKAPNIEEKEGFIFKCWYTSDAYIEKYDFNSAVHEDTTLYGYWTETENETFNVSFYDNGEIIRTDKVLKGSCAENYIPEKDGYKFTNWLNGGQVYDFSTPVNVDITLNAQWDAIKYKITFTADGNTVAEEYFTVDNKIVSVPEIPQKEHYAAKWTKFEYELKDIEVPAIYTPISYSAVFYADDEVLLELTYTVEDSIEIPEVPEKRGYTGDWEGLPLAGGDVSVTAVYTPIDYTIFYKVNGALIETQTYNIENKDITPPAVPPIAGYSGEWEEFELDIGDVTVNAKYTIKTLYAYFRADGNVIATREFTIENTEITDIPQVPHKEGFNGKWSEFALGNEDITVDAEYTPILYTASFFADGELIAEIKFTVNDTELNEPQIKNKPGYSADWEPYTITASDIMVNAVYTLETYYASFIYKDGSTVKVPYTINNEYIEEPALPVDENFVVKWENYSLPYRDFEINIIYIERITSVTSGNLQFELLADDTYCLAKYLDGGASVSEIEIPSLINNLPVTVIKRELFAFRENLKKIIIPDSVVEIEEYAFAYTSINSIVLPLNLKEIKNIFVGCKLLESITIGSGTEVIGENAFANCSALKNLIIPKIVKCIKAGAFLGCTSLQSVVFEDCSNWSVYNNENDSSGYEIDSSKLSEPEIASQYLTDEKYYLNKFWKKN